MTIGPQPPRCCTENTAECLSCQTGQTLDEYCRVYPRMIGCPGMKDVLTIIPLTFLNTTFLNKSSCLLSVNITILDIRPPTRPPPTGQLTLTVQPQDINTVFGNNVQLSCYISSTPQGKSSSDYNLYWRKQNGNISFDTNILVFFIFIDVHNDS